MKRRTNWPKRVRWGGIKEMKDTLTGNVCKCYVSFHESTNRIITMPVDAIKIPDYIYGKRLDDKQKQILASGGEVPINDIQRKNDTMLSVWPMSIRP